MPSAQVSVGTTATLVSTAQKGSVRNGHATTSIFWGTSPGVTTTDGFLIKPDEVFSWDVAPSEDVYCVAASGTVTVYVASSSSGT